MQSHKPSTGFCFNSLQNASHSSSVSKHLAKHLWAALWYLIVTSVPIFQVTCTEYNSCWWMLRCRQFPVRDRDASLVTIEALMAYRLRHSLEELLPSPRRGVYIRFICVWCHWKNAPTCKTNELLMPVIYNPNRITFSIYPSQKYV